LSHRFGWTKKPWTAQNAAENVILHPERLDQPLRWRKPRRIFVNSMSDLFHERVPDEFIDRVWYVMHHARQHTFQILTKRPERMLRWLTESRDGLGQDARLRLMMTAAGTYALGGNGGPSFCWPLPNAHLGVSVEDQRRADERVPLLLQTPAAVRFLSCEPLLGSVDLDRYIGGDWFRGGGPDGRSWPGCTCAGDDVPCEMCDALGPRPLIDWVIVGGESGPHHRPMEMAWIQDIADQCHAANVPLWVKQAAGPRPGEQGNIPDALWKTKEFPCGGSPMTDERIREKPALWDVVGVKIDRSEGGRVRILEANQRLKDAEAIVAFAVMRRGVDIEFYASVPAGSYGEGDTWAGVHQGHDA
jgi:protein gp37